MAAVVTIAITLVAGAALFGYVNSQAATSESSIGAANAKNVNFLNEKFVVVDLAIQSGANLPNNTADVWIYNNGNLALQISEIALYNRTTPEIRTDFNNNPSHPGAGCLGNGTAVNSISNTQFVFGPEGTQIQNESSPFEITLTLPSPCTFSPATTYYANVVGLYGNVAVYPECDSFSGCTS